MCIETATQLGLFSMSEFDKYEPEVMAMLHDASDDE